MPTDHIYNARFINYKSCYFIFLQYYYTFIHVNVTNPGDYNTPQNNKCAVY